MMSAKVVHVQPPLVLLSEAAVLCFKDEGSRESVVAGCRNLTATWVREKAVNDPVVELCDYYEGLEKAGPEVRAAFYS